MGELQQDDLGELQEICKGHSADGRAILAEKLPHEATAGSSLRANLQEKSNARARLNLTSQRELDACYPVTRAYVAMEAHLDGGQAGKATGEWLNGKRSPGCQHDHRGEVCSHGREEAD